MWTSAKWSNLPACQRNRERHTPHQSSQQRHVSHCRKFRDTETRGRMQTHQKPSICSLSPCSAKRSCGWCSSFSNCRKMIRHWREEPAASLALNYLHLQPDSNYKSKKKIKIVTNTLWKSVIHKLKHPTSPICLNVMIPWVVLGAKHDTEGSGDHRTNGHSSECHEWLHPKLTRAYMPASSATLPRHQPHDRLAEDRDNSDLILTATSSSDPAAKQSAIFSLHLTQSSVDISIKTSTISPAAISFMKLHRILKPL